MRFEYRRAEKRCDVCSGEMYMQKPIRPKQIKLYYIFNHINRQRNQNVPSALFKNLYDGSSAFAGQANGDDHNNEDSYAAKQKQNPMYARLQEEFDVK